MSNKIICTTFVYIGLATLSAAVIGILIIKRFVYFRPSSIVYRTKEKYTNIQQGHINAWYIKGQSDKIVLYCHGNDGNVSNCDHAMSAIHKLGYSAMVFDYSGFGKSSGVPSEQQLYDDASTMTAYLLQKYTPDNIIVYGTSMGATVAAYVSKRYGIHKLILVSPLTSIKIMIKSKFPYLSFLSIFFSEFDTLAFIIHKKTPTLMIHSTHDEIVPYNSIDKLRKHVSNFIPTSGTHNDPVIPWEQIKNFIENRYN
jgi:alpha-beta hydrolase superfamily lysophospholipase